ncbi:hypothetical protein [Streptomyces sp. NBC_01264]|uniref:hypothetical protein n=1 Tax=Streptomyces sp. NBC_01264 TaxID=2903804 RepID=UPI00224DB613|nr:hypothetical protein [Streptomyces sp. NBC_01264]MCX4784527.1 hypothetical protein [Streptomyces sp. NBC_01264]
MIYGIRRTKGAPVLGALPGQDGPFGRRPAADEDDRTDTTIKEPATTDGNAHSPVEQPSPF